MSTRSLLRHSLQSGRILAVMLLLGCLVEVASGQDDQPPAWPAAALPDVADRCNRADPAFAPVADPLADPAMERCLQQLVVQLADPQWAQLCRLPAFGVQPVRGTGARYYDKYDRHFLAAAAFWFMELKGEAQPSEVARLAYLMKVMSWYESKLGYASGFANKAKDGSRRFPLQAPGFIDTEDVMQVGNPADLPIHEKLEEMTVLEHGNAQRLADLVPRIYTHRNISGPQSIFYGTGWFAYKYVTCGRIPRAAVRRYNGNTAIGAWNGLPYCESYAECVSVLFKTGVARSPAGGDEMTLVQP